MKAQQLTKQQALEELSYLLYDVTNKSELDDTRLEEMQESIAKLIVYVTKKGK